MSMQDWNGSLSHFIIVIKFSLTFEHSGRKKKKITITCFWGGQIKINQFLNAFFFSYRGILVSTVGSRSKLSTMHHLIIILVHFALYLTVPRKHFWLSPPFWIFVIILFLIFENICYLSFISLVISNFGMFCSISNSSLVLNFHLNIKPHDRWKIKFNQSKQYFK